VKMLRERIASIIQAFRKSRTVEPRLGIAWYREDQWPQLLEVSLDAQRLEKTYGEWLAHASARYDELLKKGAPVVKVPVDVLDMAAWCRELGRQVDGAGRTAYVVYRLEEQKAGRLYPQMPPRPKRSRFHG
jgi:hypothetical protein